MINYSENKKFFTSGDEFTLTGSNYTGYVQVLSGIPYVYNTLIELSPLQTFSTDLKLSTSFTDRLASDDIILPNSYNSILIAANDYLTYDLFKDKLLKLHTNNLYTYSRLLFTENDLPTTSDIRYVGATDNNSTELSSFSNTSYANPHFEATTEFADLGRIKGFVASTITNTVDNYVMFCVTDTKFITLTSDTFNTSIIEISTNIETQENHVEFGNLSDICKNDTHIFISDSKNNVVFKYEIGGIIDSDNAFRKQRNLVEVIGGTASVSNKIKFNTPTKLACTSKYIAINDSGTYSVKIFDIELNFIKAIEGISFRREVVQTFNFDPLAERLYIITLDKSNNIKLYIYSSAFILEETHTLSESLLDGEKILNISFSQTDSNYWYLTTNYNVYKKLKNRPSGIVGRYQSSNIFLGGTTTKGNFSNKWNTTYTAFNTTDYFWNLNISNGEVTDIDLLSKLKIHYYTGFDITGAQDGTDNMIMFLSGRIYFFKESSTIKSVLKYNNLPNYGISTKAFSRDEYIQATVINKEIYKVVHDLYTLKNNLVGRFAGKYDDQGILTLTDYNYNLDFSQFTDYDESVFYVNENEKNINGVLNRSLSHIYELQQKLAQLTSIDPGYELVPAFNAEDTLILE
jgi:hypothetical protein